MELSIKLWSEWSIVYIEGPQVMITKNIHFFSLKLDLVLANISGPDEMQHYADFNLGFHCLAKYPFWGF